MATFSPSASRNFRGVRTIHISASSTVRANRPLRPMRSVGPGVAEIRVHSEGEYRVLYVAKFAEAVYVLHAFEKRARGTRHLDLELGRKCLGDVMRSRRGGWR